MNQQNSIIVVGRPEAGKSGFFGQLYNRLNYEEGEFKLVREPKNISALEPVINSYAESKAIHHTTADTYQEIIFELSYGDTQFNVKYPDYGGEQIDHALFSRNLSKRWHKELQTSNHWMLFIRVADLEKTLDPVQRFAKLVKGQESVPEKDSIDEKFMSSQARFIELIQMLLYHKGWGFAKQLPIPNLSIVLSCWDKLSDKDQQKSPEEVLKEHLPLFSDFIASNWKVGHYSIIGLSSQGKELSKTESDPDWLDVEQGYIVKPNGNHTKDLTQIFKLIPNFL